MPVWIASSRVIALTVPSDSAMPARRAGPPDRAGFCRVQSNAEHAPLALEGRAVLDGHLSELGGHEKGTPMTITR